jgi:serine phosphatase RsbU (regulator of sigma subunit)
MPRGTTGPTGARSDGHRRPLSPERVSRPAVRVAVLLALLLAVFGLLHLNTQPGLAASLYGLIPIVLGVFWFSLPGGLFTATATTFAFLGDELLTPSQGLVGAEFWFAVFNRVVVFYGVAVLVTWLLRRERRLLLQVEAQRAELAELESLRAALTPSDVPPRPGLQLATSFFPADGEVAGDFFLVVEGPNDSTTIVVGDVVGHGLEAARCAAFVRAALATFARFSSDPAQLLELADTALTEHRGHTNPFVTAVCLNISHPPEVEIRWAAAGHQAPWCLDTGTSLRGGRIGAPLGIGVGELRVETGRVPLEPGAGVLVFTDGLTEGRAARRPLARRLELFGEERARRILRDRPGAPVERIVEALVSEVTTFAHGPLADDLCLVAVRARPGSGEGTRLAA